MPIHVMNTEMFVIEVDASERFVFVFERLPCSHVAVELN